MAMVPWSNTNLFYSRSDIQYDTPEHLFVKIEA